MTTFTLIQARMGSTRLPEKVLAPLDGRRRLLDCVIDLIEACRPEIERTVVATSVCLAEQPLVEHCREREVQIVQGDEKNVLQRFVQVLDAVDAAEEDVIVRVCADNPLIDEQLATELLPLMDDPEVDYAAHAFHGNCPAICTPAGLFVECVRASALRRLLATEPPLELAEHVTLGIYTDTGYRCRWIEAPSWAQAPWLRLTCDTPEDLDRLQTIFAAGQDHQPRSALIEWIARRPELRKQMLEENQRHPKPSLVVKGDILPRYSLRRVER